MSAAEAQRRPTPPCRHTAPRMEAKPSTASSSTGANGSRLASPLQVRQHMEKDDDDAEAVEQTVATTIPCPMLDEISAAVAAIPSQSQCVGFIYILVSLEPKSGTGSFAVRIVCAGPKL